MKKNEFLYSHQERLKKLQERDGSTDRDTERTALFYIIAGNDDLYSKVEHIYDFKERAITDCLENSDIDFCSSSRKLIRLAYNLFNGYNADVLDTFYVLDERNFKLALNALRIRFNQFDGTYVD